MKYFILPILMLLLLNSYYSTTRTWRRTKSNQYIYKAQILIYKEILTNPDTEPETIPDATIIQNIDNEKDINITFLLPKGYNLPDVNRVEVVKISNGVGGGELVAKYPNKFLIHFELLHCDNLVNSCIDLVNQIKYSFINKETLHEPNNFNSYLENRKNVISAGIEKLLDTNDMEKLKELRSQILLTGQAKLLVDFINIIKGPQTFNPTCLEQKYNQVDGASGQNRFTVNDRLLNQFKVERIEDITTLKRILIPENNTGSETQKKAKHKKDCLGCMGGAEESSLMFVPKLDDLNKLLPFVKHLVERNIKHLDNITFGKNFYTEQLIDFLQHMYIPGLLNFSGFNVTGADKKEYQKWIGTEIVKMFTTNGYNIDNVIPGDYPDINSKLAERDISLNNFGIFHLDDKSRINAFIIACNEDLKQIITRIKAVFKY
jgi:hypothetical protein